MIYPTINRETRPSFGAVYDSETCRNLLVSLADDHLIDSTNKLVKSFGSKNGRPSAVEVVVVVN